MEIQRKTDVKNMKKNYFDYYENKLKIKQAYESYGKLFAMSSQKEESADKLNAKVILDNKLSDLGDLELRVQNLLNKIRNNYSNLIFLIDHLSEDNKTEMAEFFSHFFFENILIQNPEFDEILIFCFILLEKEIDSLFTPSLDSFLEFSFMGRFLKSLCRRLDIKNYLSLTLKDLIYELENQSENFMDIDLTVINEKIKTNKIDKSFFEYYSDHDLEKIKVLYENNKNLGLAYNIRFSSLNNNYLRQKPQPSRSYEMQLSQNILDKANKHVIDITNSQKKQQENKINEKQKGLFKANYPDAMNLQLEKASCNNAQCDSPYIELICNSCVESPSDSGTSANTLYDFNKKVYSSKDADSIFNKSAKNEQAENSRLEKKTRFEKPEKENPKETFDEDEINHDYKFDISEDEIVRRYLKETDLELKDYCNIKYDDFIFK